MLFPRRRDVAAELPDMTISPGRTAGIWLHFWQSAGALDKCGALLLSFRLYLK
jgi:hypothetical protein